MQYRRMPIEVESPEEFGYDRIACNLAESSVTDAVLSELNVSLKDLTLFYGDHRGLPDLREAIAQEYGLQPEDILITAGAASALFIVATALLDPSSRLLVMHPNYATNLETPRAIGCNIQTLSLAFDSAWQLDLSTLTDSMKPPLKLLSLTTPHNPTGQNLTKEQLQKAITAIERTASWLLVDETYRDLSFKPLEPVAAALSSQAITVSSFSKALGLPGIRIGWIACQNQQLMETFLAAKEQIFICNSVVDETIALQVLQRKSEHMTRIKAHVNGNLDILKNWMANQSWLEWVEPQGGVVCFPRVKPEYRFAMSHFYQRLRDDYQTVVGPGHWFEMPNYYMRLGFGWPDAKQLEQGLRNIGRVFEDNGSG